MSDSIDPVIIFDFEHEGLQQAGLGEDLVKLKHESEKALNLALGTIRGMADHLSKAIRQLEREVMPDEAEIEFGIKLEVESGSVISLVTKASTGGQLNVKFKWRIERPNTPTILLSSSSDNPNP